MDEILKSIDRRLDRIEGLMFSLIEELSGDEQVEEWLETEDQEKTQ